jgi:putative hydrolase of the HAD superfamily
VGRESFTRYSRSPYPKDVDECSSERLSGRRLAVLQAVRCKTRRWMADPRPKAILLDALGTLVALEPPAPRLRAQLARLGVRITEAQAAHAIAAEIAYYRAHFDEGRDPPSLASLRTRCAEVVRSSLPAGSGIENVDAAAMTQALLHSLRFTPFADVRPALERWRARRLALVVVSNWDVSLHEVLTRVGLSALLDRIVTSAEAGMRKPSPAIFERALRLVGARPSDAIHIGDALIEDVQGAQAAGIESLLLCRDDGPVAPGICAIKNLAELNLGPEG